MYRIDECSPLSRHELARGPLGDDGFTPPQSLEQTIELRSRYSIPILRYLQDSDEAIQDVRNARAELMNGMKLPSERKGTRLGVQDALDELESCSLIELGRDPNRNASKTTSILLTETGRILELPAEESKNGKKS